MIRRTPVRPDILRIEILEARISPATLNLAGGVLTYTAGNAVANSLTLSISGANYVLNDVAEFITLGAGATAAGFTGGGTNTVQGPNTAVNAIDLQTGDADDQVSLQGLNDSLTVNTGAGANDSIVILGALNAVAGSTFSITAESITVNAAINAGASAEFVSNSIAVGAAVTATDHIQLRTLVTLRPINLGTEAATDLSLTDVELDRLSAGVLRIGVANGGAITITQPITLGAKTLALRSAQTITDSGTGSLAVDFLGLSSTLGVTLDSPNNDLNTIAGTVLGSGADFAFREADALIVGNVDGIVGISTTPGNDIITLTAGTVVIQTAGSTIKGTFLELLGVASYTLTDPGNDVVNLSANIGGTLSWVDLDALNIGVAGATIGITTSNDNVTVSTVQGFLTVQNDDGDATPDISAGTGVVILTAGGVGAVDQPLNINANAGIVATGGVILTGDNISIGATVNAGTNTAILRQFQIGTIITLGSADAASTLGITDAELDLVTAGILVVGRDDAVNGIAITAAISPAGTSQLELITGGVISDSNGVGTDITVARLGLTATSTIGVATLDIAISNLEARTDGGGIFINNTGALTIGGVNATLTGLNVVTSGNITIATTNGTITLAEVDGVEIVHAGNTSGDVTLTAGGATSDVTVTVDQDAITAPMGSVSVNAGQDILLGTVTTNQDNDVRANGTITFTAGRDIAVDGFSDISADDFGQNTGGGVTFVASRDIAITDVHGNDASVAVNGSGAVVFTAAVNVIVRGPVSTNGAGTITITADSDNNFTGDFTSSASGTLSTLGGSITVRGGTDSIHGNVMIIGNPVTVNGGSGSLTLSSAGNVSVNAALSVTGSGAISVTADSNFNASGIFANSAAGTLTTVGGLVTITAADLSLGGTINVTTATFADVFLQPSTPATVMRLGTDAAFGLTDVELDRITASALIIGTNTNTGGIQITGQITLDPAKIPSLQLLTGGAGGAITDNTAGEQIDVTVQNLLLNANAGVGAAGVANLDTAITNLAARNTSATTGAINITNTSAALSVAAVGTGFVTFFGVDNSNANAATGSVTITNTGSFTVTNFIQTRGTGAITLDAGTSFSVAAFNSISAGDAAAGGAITIRANVGNAGGTGDLTVGTNTSLLTRGDITLDADPDANGTGGAVVLGAGGKLAGPSSSLANAITLRAAADITLNALSAVGTVTVTSSGGAIFDGNDPATGTNNVKAASLALSAKTGIGAAPNPANPSATAADAPLETQVDSLEAVTQTGGIFISNTSATLNIGGVSAIDGVQVTTSGNLQLINNGGSIIVGGTSTEDIRTASGDVLIQAVGATANVETRNDSADAIDSNAGNVTVFADQDILVGSAAVDNFGDLEANGNLVLNAGRDITLDENAFVDVFGAGTLSVSAGRNIAMLASDGTTGARISSQGGAITASTGVDGTLTLDSNVGAGGTIRSSNAGGNGNINLNVDRIDITASDTIVAGTGIVTIAPISAARAIDLGGADGASVLGVTDAELDAVTAGIIRIGNPLAGGINVTAAISPANSNTLRLQSAQNVLDGAAGAITVANLAIDGNAINFNSGLHTVGTLAGRAGGLFTNAFNFFNTTPLTVGTVDTFTGINAARGGITLTTPGALNINAALAAAGLLSFTSAGVSQSAPITQTAAGAVTINAGAGNIALTHASNDFLGIVTLSTSGAEAIADANDLVLAGQAIPVSLAIGAAGTVTQTGAFTGAGSLTFNGPGTLILTAANAFGGTTLVNAGTLAGTGSLSGPLQIAAGASLAPDSSGGIFSAGNTAFAAGSTFVVQINGTTPGVNHSQLALTGTINLAGATLDASAGFSPPPSSQIILINNDAADPVSGTFAGLPEGEAVSIDGRLFVITYLGGDGNDVALRTPPPLVVNVINAGKAVTFTDVDGDLVTVKTNKGTFTAGQFSGIETGLNGAGQLQALTLGAGFTGAKIKITAKRTANGGNGFVSVGLLNATGVDLGTVSVAGDLGRVLVGSVGGDVKVPAMKSLTARSLGLLGISTQDAGSLDSIFEGALPKLTLAGDLRGSLTFHGGTDGKLGTATIRGSFVSQGALTINADAGIGTLKIGGDIRAAAGAGIIIATRGAIGTVAVGGSIVGDAIGTVSIFSFGKIVGPATGLDTALSTLNVRGSVEFLEVGAGQEGLGNRDAAIGSIIVGGDWIASSVRAGTAPGADGKTGTDDDTGITFGLPRDAAKIFSTIGNISIKGQALGTFASSTDMFGIVAEHINKAKIGGRTFAFVADNATVEHHEAFFAAPTGPGSGDGNPVFDFTVRELGALTLNPTLAIDLDVSSQGTTATFTDVDGDLVTIKATIGTFTAGNFTIAAAPSGGGQLQALTLGGAFENANITITASPGANGGNGFVNVGAIVAAGVNLGTVTVAGDFGRINVGDSTGLALKTLTAHSVGALGTSTQNAGDLLSNLSGGATKLAINGDVRDATLKASGTTGKLASVLVAGALVGGAATINADAGMGPVKVGGSVRGGHLVSGAAIGPINVGVDLIGDGATATISAFGKLPAPTAGIDLAIAGVIIKGGVENARIEAGTNSMNANADAAIGAISVGREWLGSSVLVGIKAAGDGFVGTADDAKVTGSSSTRDVSKIFSQIASITIKGQAFGSTAFGDAFGIVAEKIGKAKIGAVSFKLDAGERDAVDAFAAAPTQRTLLLAPSDFFIRECVV